MDLTPQGPKEEIQNEFQCKEDDGESIIEREFQYSVQGPISLFIAKIRLMRPDLATNQLIERIIHNHCINVWGIIPQGPKEEIQDEFQCGLSFFFNGHFLNFYDFKSSRGKEDDEESIIEREFQYSVQGPISLFFMAKIRLMHRDSAIFMTVSE
ncbi:hypothetical protein CEXT_134411 [Caerostris extrusa]|uniref:Uncharacterized protein n=1 Tax=Caerostris extrusa TaxID=172846 RepID=A0AAV4X370_CAEEX|nr:hypothetical protein CEXT_134411 [Caerostris extrusa]